MGQDAIPWIMLAATIFAVAAAIGAWRQALAVSKSTTSSNLINCLNAYITVMRARTKAIEDKSEEQCKSFYRELFDLHWTEFQMWRDGLIPNHVIEAWLAVRGRNYREDSIQFDKDGKVVIVSYKQVWDDLIDRRYFEPTDRYLDLMKIVHDEKLTDIKTLRKQFGRKESKKK